jgi:hypothetical protein
LAKAKGMDNFSWQIEQRQLVHTKPWDSWMLARDKCRARRAEPEEAARRDGVAWRERSGSIRNGSPFF